MKISGSSIPWVLIPAAAFTAAAGAADVLPSIGKGNISIRLQPVATGLGAPDYAISPPGDSTRLFVLEQKGLVLIVKNGSLLAAPALDLRSLVAPPLNLTNANDERGLLGLAFHPGFGEPNSPGYRTLYTYNSQPLAAPTYLAPNNATQNYENAVNEWKLSSSDPDLIDPLSRREVISFGKNANNHNGGTIAFGPDGYLYLGLGDGGNANDLGPSHLEPGGNAQNLSTPLGKMLRLDPLRPTLTPGSPDPPAGSGQYRIPLTNPFQAAGQVPEIYAIGFRNPYRFAFDRQNGQLIVADVGQNNVEEINRVGRGENFGWPLKEGDFLFNRVTGAGGNAGTVGVRSPGSPAGMVDPIAGSSGTLEYDHEDGISITGGFVYRGNEIPGLQGKYVFGDLALHSGQTRADGRLFYADLETGLIQEFLLPFTPGGVLPNGLTVHGFGENADGELFALVTNTAPAGAGGIIYAIRNEPLTPIETWRQIHFNLTTNAGDASNESDYDRDGLPNLVEFAFGLDPKNGASLAIPQPQRIDGNVVATFTQPAGVSGITYRTEWSATMEPTSWTSIADTGAGASHVFSIPWVGDGKVFLRYVVTSP